MSTELERRKEQLAARLSESTNNVEILNSVNSIQDMSIQIIGNLNVTLLKKEADREAKDFVESVAEYYLDERTRRMKMIKKKMKADTTNVSSVIFTLKVNEHTMSKCLEIVDQGQAPPPVFQVMAKLIEQSIMVSKHQSSERSILTDTYRILKAESSTILHHENELEVKDAAEGGAPAQESNIRTRGTRQLVDLIKKDNEENPVEKEVDQEPVIRATNPNIRPSANGIDPPKETIDDTSVLDMDDDIFN